MTETEFIQRWAEAISEDPSEVKAETSLKSLAGWDSMGKVTTLGFLDEAVGVQLAPGALQHCQVVGDLVALAKDKLCS